MGILQVIITCLLVITDWTAGLRNNETYREGTMDRSDMLDANLTDLIKTIRYMNEDLPDECRYDSCSMEEIKTDLNGVFKWPNTTVGMRRYIQCPYADDDEALYAYRDCLPLDEYLLLWTAQNISECPGPPLQRKMEQYLDQTLTEQWFTLAYWEQYIQEVYDITEKHPDAQVYPGDIDILVIMFEDYMYKTYYLSGCNLIRSFENILLLSDYAMSKWSPKFELEEITKIRLLEVMTTIIQKLPGGTKLREPTHQYLLNMTTVEQRHVGPQPLCIGSDTQNFTDKDCLVKLEVDLQEPDVELKTLVILDDFPRKFVFRVYEPFIQLLPPIIVGPTRISHDSSHAVTDPLFDLTAPVTHSSSLSPSHNTSNDYIFLSDTVTTPSYRNPQHNSTGTFSSRPPNIFPTTLPTVSLPIPMLPPPPPPFHRPIMYFPDPFNRFYTPWGPLVYISIDTPGGPPSIINEVILTFKLRYIWMEWGWFRFAGTVVCGNLLESRTLLDDGGTARVWSPDQCIREKPIHVKTHEKFPETVTCRCKATTGYFGVFVADVASYLSQPGDITTIQPPGGIDKFLGFAYNYEIYVTNHVLRAVSLVCLLLTIISFIAFRKLRSGSPAYILINLCAALIALNLVLYITEGIAHTKMGCRASNLLRYCFILVTLLWNAVEAVNMYVKLVKVFHSHMSMFTRKAAGFAWGLPLIPVIILLAVDKTSFDGYYVDCKFRCLLRTQVLHYALLVPIGVIMLFNLVIFGIVFSVIIKHGATRQNQGKRTWLTKLFGAIALLALLGVPWIFAGFGAIDPNGDWRLQLVELIFQVIFVVLFNLQGIFIFLFHCARNSKVRNEWRSSLSTSASWVSSRRESQPSLPQADKGHSTDYNKSNTKSINTNSV